MALSFLVFMWYIWHALLERFIWELNLIFQLDHSQRQVTKFCAIFMIPYLKELITNFMGLHFYNTQFLKETKHYYGQIVMIICFLSDVNYIVICKRSLHSWRLVLIYPVDQSWCFFIYLEQQLLQSSLQTYFPFDPLVWWTPTENRHHLVFNCGSLLFIWLSVIILRYNGHNHFYRKSSSLIMAGIGNKRRPFCLPAMITQRKISPL